MFNFFRKIFSQQLSSEAYEAYFHKLPEKICVEWFRDSGFIIGKISADEKQFKTQGKNPDDFVDMVNDSVYAVYEIPEEYKDALKRKRNYLPSQEQYKLLNNGKVPYSKFASKKELVLA